MQAYVQITVLLPRSPDVSERVSQIVGTTLAADGKVTEVVNNYPPDLALPPTGDVTRAEVEEHSVSNGRGKRRTGETAVLAD